LIIPANIQAFLAGIRHLKVTAQAHQAVMKFKSVFLCLLYLKRIDFKAFEIYFKSQ